MSKQNRKTRNAGTGLLRSGAWEVEIAEAGPIGRNLRPIRATPGREARAECVGGASQPATFVPLRRLGGAALMLGALWACSDAGGPDGVRGPVIGSRAQHISFGPLPMLSPGTSARVSAAASSGLPVRYFSNTPAVCAAALDTGELTVRSGGTCSIIVSQRGDTTWAPVRTTLDITVRQGVQRIVLGEAPALTVGSLATIDARVDSGLPLRFESSTPAICSVDADSGRVTALAAGNCRVAVDQPGDANHQPAERVVQQLTVAAAASMQAPAAPSGVRAVQGDAANTVQVSAGSLDGGGAAVQQYLVTSTPAGISAAGSSLPVVVTCPDSCAGHAFSLAARNAQGTGPASEAVDVITGYDVVVKFREPDYAHNMTEFHGRFSWNATRRTVSGLQGELSEVMAGNNQPGQPWPDGMPLLPLRHQLSSIASPTGDGLLVTSFLLNHTRTLSNDPRDRGTDGWSPGTGSWKYWGYAGGDRSSPNPGNAYIRIFVNTQDPTRPLTQAHLDMLAYADCAAQGMMGDDCMTGTTAAGYGSLGSMRGYPISQEITRRR